MNTETLIKNWMGIVNESQIITDPEELYRAAADRYKKYAKAKKVLDVPIPKAIVYPHSAQEVSELLVFCKHFIVFVIDSFFILDIVLGPF